MHVHGGSGATDLPSSPSHSIPRPPISRTQTITGVNATSQLVALPEELLSNIALRLGPDDLFALRQTCRDVETKTLHEFAKEYFHAKCFMFTTPSLQVMVSISESAKLSCYLKDVYFLTAAVPDRVGKCPRGDACSWRPSIRQREALIDYRTDQATLKESGKDKQLITKAFLNLKNLNLLALVGDDLFLPVGVECHGLRKFKRATKISPVIQPAGGSHDHDYYSCLSHVWRTMMLAVGQSGTTSIKRLETRFGSENVSGLSPVSDLRFKDTTIEVLSRCFANLEDISIVFRSIHFRANKPDSANVVADVARATKRMKSFAPVFRNAKNLKLALDFGTTTGILGKAFLSAFDLSKLTKLVLDSVFIELKLLASIICKLKSAQFLTMHSIEITGGTWVPILKALQALPELRHLHLFYLQEQNGRCFFLEKDDSADEEGAAGDFDLFAPIDLSMQGDAGETDVNWEDSSDASDEMSDLIDINPGVADVGPAQQEPDRGLPPLPIVNDCPLYSGEDFRDKAMPKRAGRGYFVCLRDSHIQEKLPTLIKEYRTVAGDLVLDDPNALLNMMGGGIVAPMAAPQPNPGTGTAQGGPAAQAGQGSQGTGGQGGGGGGGAGGSLGMLTGLLAGAPTAAGGNQTQTHAFSIPSSSLVGGFGLPPATQQPAASTATGQSTTSNVINHTTIQAGPSNTTAGASSMSASVEDHDDDPTSLVALELDDWMEASDIEDAADDEETTDDVD